MANVELRAKARAHARARIRDVWGRVDGRGRRGDAPIFLRSWRIAPEMMEEYLRPTAIIDNDNTKVRNYAHQAAEGGHEAVEKAVQLYLAVRDGIRYDPYAPFYRPEHYRAGYVLERGRSFCIPKASLLCALGRVCKIPSRVGFATVKNHLATRQLLDFLGSNLFVYHGFVEFYLEGKWVRATPAFNRELCHKHRVPPLEFNGIEDSVFQAYNLDNQKFMEYVEYLGSTPDIPVALILQAWKKAYGEDRVNGWIAALEAQAEESGQDFYAEDPLIE
jgi:transglutaminase-like putative cysteine protease